MGLGGGSYDYSNSEQTKKDHRRRGARVNRAAKEGTQRTEAARRREGRGRIGRQCDAS